MMNPRKTSLSFAIAAALFSTAFASETTGETSTQLTSATNTATTSSIITNNTKQPLATESQEPSRASFMKGEGKTKLSVRRSNEKPEELGQPTTAVNVAKKSTRTEQFTITRDSKTVKYTLPKSLENAQIEFSSLDGKYVTLKNHNSHDIGGAFDTTALESGRYIIRLVDENDKKTLLTRAITINK